MKLISNKIYKKMKKIEKNNMINNGFKKNYKMKKILSVYNK